MTEIFDLVKPFKSLKYLQINYKGVQSVWGGPQDLVSPISLSVQLSQKFGKQIQIFEPASDTPFKGRVLLLVLKHRFPIITINLAHCHTLPLLQVLRTWTDRQHRIKSDDLLFEKWRDLIENKELHIIIDCL